VLTRIGGERIRGDDIGDDEHGVEEFKNQESVRDI